MKKQKQTEILEKRPPEGHRFKSHRGRIEVFKKMLQAVPASLFSEKDYTLLSIEFFFWKKGFKITFLLLFNSILRLRLPEWKVLLEV